MKKIIYIIVGLNQGGAETVLYRLISSPLINKNFKITVISLTDLGFYGKKIESLGIEVICLHMKKFNFLSSVFKLYKILRKTRPDIVQTWMYHANLLGGLLAKLASTKRIIWSIRAAGIHLKRKTALVSYFSAILSQFISPDIVYCAYSAKTNHENLGYNPNKSIVIPNGYDIPTFDSDAKANARKAFGFPADKIIIGGLGRNHTDKDFSNFIQAASLVLKEQPDVVFALCGKNIPELSTILDEKNVHKSFLLLPSTDRPLDYLSSLDIFVLSSRTEAFPNVVAEAMACGAAVVSTNVGDAAIIVGDEGIIVPAQDAEKLAKGMLELLEKDKENIKILKNNARKKIVETYSFDKMLQSYEQLYRE